MKKELNPYNLSIKGIDKKLFLSDPFYCTKSKRIDFDGIIREFEVEASGQIDYLSLAPKFKPHSDYELMVQSTDSILKSSAYDLTKESIHEILKIGYKFVEFLSNPTIVKKYGMNDGYMYFVYNYDQYTTDRHSGMSNKNFHMHMNSWKNETIKTIKPVEKGNVSSFYYQSIIDPIFEFTQILANDALSCEEFSKFIKPSAEQNDKIAYSSVYEVVGGWNTLKNEDFAELLRLIHKKLEQRYKEILICFTGKDSIPDLYTRHQILKKKDVLLNVERSNFQDSTKEILIAHVDKIKSITNEQFQRLISRPNLRDTLICLRWLAYSVGFFSENYINDEISYKDKPLYINVTPRLFTKIGGASILNFPDHPIVKIDRGLGDISKEEFETQKAKLLGE